MNARTTTQLEWVNWLEAESAAIAAMNLSSRVTGNDDLNATAYNLANSREHNALIVRGIESLLADQSQPQAETESLLLDLTGRDTYGKFSELAAYDWLSRSRVQFAAQIRLPPTEILGMNEVKLDGCISHANLYFDIKAFGFHGLLAKRLKERLSEHLPGLDVFIEGTWDIATDDFRGLIADAPAIARQVTANGSFAKGGLHVRVASPKPVSISTRMVSPYALAKENAKFPFTSANQFARNAPFLLIYVLHPWLNNNTIHTDFAGGDSCFTRAFARRAFFQFSNDASPVRSVCSKVDGSVSFSGASKLLSGIMFINVWPTELYPATSSEAKPVPSWIYLNPRAAHRISEVDAQCLRANRHTVTLDAFEDDDY